MRVTDHLCSYACPEHCADYRTSDERVILAFREDSVRGQGRPSEGNDTHGSLSKSLFCDKHNLSGTTFDRGRVVSRYEDLAEDVVQGRTSLRSAAESAKERRRAEKRADVLWTPDYRKGRFQDKLVDIPDDSVDAVVSDVPWGEKLYPMDGLYDDLGALCARVLKPGGLAALIVGQVAMLDLADAMRAAGLTYGWTVSYQGPTGFHGPLQVAGHHYPLLIFRKGDGPTNLRGKADVIKGGVVPAEQKSHRFQKTVEGMRAIIEMVSDPGDLIVDPCAGSNPTGKAARLSGRRSISCTINPCE